MLTCCCPTCDIATDNFNRANESPLASPWTKLSGTDATLTSNVLDMSAAAFYRHNTAYSGAVTESRTASVKFKKATADGFAVDLCIGVTDVNNYFLARVNIPASGCPVLTACAVVAGVPTCGFLAGSDLSLEGLDNGIGEINVPKTTVAEWHTLEVCLIPNSGSYGYETYDELRVKLTTADGTIYATRWWGPGPAIGTYAGVKAWGAAQFDDFAYRFFRNSPTDEHRACPNCNTPCAIGSDDFATSVPCNWHQAEGAAYSISSGVMNVAASSSVAFHLPHPMYKTSGIINVDLIWDVGIIARVDLGWASRASGNGAGYVLLNSTTLEMKLYNNAGTLLDTATGLPVADLAYYAVELCHFEDSGVLSATAFGKRISGVTTGLVSNPFAFLGAGAGNSVRFDNFSFVKGQDTDEPSDGGCSRCIGSINCSCCSTSLPTSLIVDFGAGGLTTNPPGTCTLCEQITGELVLDYSNSCTWIHVVGTCNETNIRRCTDSPIREFGSYTLILWASIVRDAAGDCRWMVRLGPSGTTWQNPTDAKCTGNYGLHYLSAPLSSTDCAAAFPVTLNRQGGGTDPCTPPHAKHVCCGVPPATIAIDVI